MRALPLTRAEGQAANCNRHGDCPRAIRLHLGDQSRAHATSTGVTSLRAVDRSSREVRSTGPQPLLLQSESGGNRGHQSCRGEGGTTAGEILKPIMWPIIRSTPDAKPGTAPDEKTEMRYPTRASAPVHRRLWVPPSPLPDPSVQELHDESSWRWQTVRCVLDWGHQNGMVRPCSCPATDRWLFCNASFDGGQMTRWADVMGHKEKCRRLQQTSRGLLGKLVIWNASSPHYRRALGASKGERLWRMQVGEAGRSRRWC